MVRKISKNKKTIKRPSPLKGKGRTIKAPITFNLNKTTTRIPAESSSRPLTRARVKASETGWPTGHISSRPTLGRVGVLAPKPTFRPTSLTPIAEPEITRETSLIRPRVYSGTPVGELIETLRSSPTVISPSGTPEDEKFDMLTGRGEGAEIAGTILDTAGRFIGYLTKTGAQLLASGASVLKEKATEGMTSLYNKLPPFEDLVASLKAPPITGLPRGSRIDEIDMNIRFFFNYNNYIDITYDERDSEFVRIYGNMPLTYINGPIRKIGGNSANGVAELVCFSKTEKLPEERGRNLYANYRMFNVIKVSREAIVDNNYYEFLVGLCLNKLKRYVPNFLFTFSYLELSHEAIREMDKVNNYGVNSDFLKNPRAITKKVDYTDTTMSLNEHFETSCKHSEYSAILIEGLPNSITLYEWIKTNFNHKEFINILFQIYYTLDKFKNYFTHYDLHSKNILLQKIPDNKYITIEYEGLEVIKTQYIPVIIDYGRCFIDCKIFGLPEIISKKFADKMCEIDECMTRKIYDELGERISCETKNNKLIRRDERRNPKVHDRLPRGLGLINSEVRNISQDNRLIFDCFLLLESNSIDPRGLRSYLDFNTWRPYNYASVENTFNGYTNMAALRNSLNNVTDTFNWLKDMYIESNSQTKDRPMFIPPGAISEYGRLTIFRDRVWNFSFRKEF